MSPDDMKALMKCFYGMWEGKSSVRPEDICAATYLDHMPHPGPQGLEGVTGAVQMMRAAFPDSTSTPGLLLVDGDKVVGTNTFRGTHTGQLMNIAPTGRKAEMATIDICRIEGGKIAEIWHVEDMFALMIQLGVVPPPG